MHITTASKQEEEEVDIDGEEKMSTSSFIPWSLLVLVLLSLHPSLLAAADGDRAEMITASNGAVAADHMTCSAIGRDVLLEGGHAVDAAVATALCLGVVNPGSSGIGGGAFMLVRLANGEVQAFDVRETAPAAASENMYNGNASMKASGPLSIAVPGEVAGLYEAWKQYGKLPWKRLVVPAEVLARDGFKVSPYLRSGMEGAEEAIKTDKGLRDIFTSNGQLLMTGDLCRNWNLANTLREISRDGMRPFYNGSVGLNLVRDVAESGGILTMNDLRTYIVRRRKPISTELLGLKILAMPPPSSGGVAMSLILNILKQYGFPKGDNSSLTEHREIEALKHAFALRMNLGDPDFVNITEVVSDMLSPIFAAELKKTIYDNMTFDPSYYGARWNILDDHGTSHVSIVDTNRNAVSMTNTINSYFGAKYLSPSTGIVLNNQMDDFSMPIANQSSNIPPPAPTNFVAPFKRPLSSMTPTIILQDEKLRAVVGASGGPTIIGGVTEVLLNYFVKGMDPLSAVMAPRYYHPLIPNVVRYENWTNVIGDHFELPGNTRANLQEKGHVLEGLAGNSVCQFVVQKLEISGTNSSFGSLVAVSDPRKNGFPAGF